MPENSLFCPMEVVCLVSADVELDPYVSYGVSGAVMDKVHDASVSGNTQ